jgi:hypothetical protein
MNSLPSMHFGINLLRSVRQGFESMEIHNSKVARLLCKIIPAHCPFERRIQFLQHTILYIPPLCKLNPFYDQLVELRLKSLAYIVEECGEDIKL